MYVNVHSLTNTQHPITNVISIQLLYTINEVICGVSIHMHTSTPLYCCAPTR